MAFPPATINDDLILSTNDPTDFIDGLAGIDTVSYATATSAVNVSLSIAGPQNTGGSGVDTLISIENITGSNFNDTLQGDAFNNFLNGGLGNDFVSYSSAAGSVTVNLQSGSATGAAGFDTLFSIENAIGSNFSDTIFGNKINNVIASDGGNDIIIGSLGSDVIDGGLGMDTVNYVSFTGGSISLGAFGVVTKPLGATDQLSNVESIIATSSNQDTINLSLATPIAYSTLVDLRGFFQMVQMNFITDALPIFLGVSQFENVIGSGVHDNITGDNLANNLSGNGGNDLIAGGSSNDTIAGGLGNDTLTGEADNDFFVFGDIGAANRDTITDFSTVQDTIILTNSLDSTLVGSLALGIKGLTFLGGVLSNASLFKGVGFTGAGIGNLTGIYVDTTIGGAGNIYYNDSTVAGSFIFASVGAAAAVALTNADFVYAV